MSTENKAPEKACVRLEIFTSDEYREIAKRLREKRRENVKK